MALCNLIVCVSNSLTLVQSVLSMAALDTNLSRGMFCDLEIMMWACLKISSETSWGIRLSLFIVKKAGGVIVFHVLLSRERMSLVRKLQPLG